MPVARFTKRGGKRRAFFLRQAQRLLSASIERPFFAEVHIKDERVLVLRDLSLAPVDPDLFQVPQRISVWLQIAPKAFLIVANPSVSNQRGRTAISALRVNAYQGTLDRLLRWKNTSPYY